MLDPGAATGAAWREERPVAAVKAGVGTGAGIGEQLSYPSRTGGQAVPGEPGQRCSARNEVYLTGRLPAGGQERVLRSGDVLVTFRVTVERSTGGRAGRTYDTLDCVAWPPEIRDEVLGWASGDVVEIEGALRRRFWRTAAGPASRYEVDVAVARRCRPASGATGSDGVSPC